MFEPGRVERAEGAELGAVRWVQAYADDLALFPPFRSQQLRSQASSCSSSPGAGQLEDLNGDGVPEVMVDATNHYIFCYACGVRLVDFQVLR